MESGGQWGRCEGGDGGGQWGRFEGVMMLVTGECREGDGTGRLPLDHQQTLKQTKTQHIRE